MKADRVVAPWVAADARAACPLCERPNACALAAGTNGPCWCKDANFSPALRERARRMPGPPRCICAACASAEVTDGEAATPPTR